MQRKRCRGEVDQSLGGDQKADDGEGLRCRPAERDRDGRLLLGERGRVSCANIFALEWRAEACWEEDRGMVGTWSRRRKACLASREVVEVFVGDDSVSWAWMWATSRASKAALVCGAEWYEGARGVWRYEYTG